MQQANEVQVKPVQRIRPTVLPQGRASSRLAYIDILRLVLVVLVIMVHAAVTYGSLGDWTYVDPVRDELTAVLLSFFVILSQSFFMGLFFFFSGYFTPGSFDRKGIAPFWKDRLLRLAVPMVVYTWVLSKVPNYIAQVAQGTTKSFLEYSLSTFWSSPDKGPTWFLFALLAFSVGYTLWRLVARLVRADRLSWVSRLPVPKTLALLGLALVMAVGMFVVGQFVPIAQTYTVLWIFDLQMAFFPQYILLFIAGILAYRNDWLTRLPGKALRFWGWLSAGLAILLPVFFFLGGAPSGHLGEFMSGLNWRCVLLNLWFGLACVSFSTTLTLWLRDQKNTQGRLAAFVGSNNYAVYLIHPLVLVPITFGLSFLAIHSLVKFGIASLLTVVLCFLLADGLRRLPGARAIL